MNWYKKIITGEILTPGETLEGYHPNYWFEAMQLKDGTIIYEKVLNHYALYWRNIRFVGDINNVDSIGLLGGDGIYQVKLKGEEARDYLKAK